MGHVGTSCPSHAGAAFGVSASRVGEVISSRLPFQTLPRHLSSFLQPQSLEKRELMTPEDPLVSLDEVASGLSSSLLPAVSDCDL